MAGAYLWGWDESTETWVKCQVTPEGKLIINPTGFLENPPTEDETKKAPTSEWAFDHAANVAAHHAKYSDGEAIMAPGTTKQVVTIGTYNALDVTGCAMIIFDTSSGNITMNGMAGGVDGQIIFAIKSNYAFQVRFNYNSASAAVGDRFRPITGVAQVLASGSWGGITLVYYDDNWHIDRYLFHSSSAFFQDSPGNGITNLGPTSNWAYDHENASDAHHERYYDKEAVDAFQSRDTTFTTGTIDDFDATSVSMVWLDTTDGDINLRGMKGGYSGKIVFFVRTNCDNSVYLRHAHATPDVGDRFYIAGGDKTMGVGAYGGFIAVYKDPAWQVFFGIP